MGVAVEAAAQQRPGSDSLASVVAWGKLSFTVFEMNARFLTTARPDPYLSSCTISRQRLELRDRPTVARTGDARSVHPAMRGRAVPS